jgi:hypothetical protein
MPAIAARRAMVQPCLISAWSARSATETCGSASPASSPRRSSPYAVVPLRIASIRRTSSSRSSTRMRPGRSVDASSPMRSSMPCSRDASVFDDLISTTSGNNRSSSGALASSNQKCPAPARHAHRYRPRCQTVARLCGGNKLGCDRPGRNPDRHAYVLCQSDGAPSRARWSVQICFSQQRSARLGHRTPPARPLRHW